MPGINSGISQDQLERFLDFVYFMTNGEPIHVWQDPGIVVTFEATGFSISLEENGKRLMIGYYNPRLGTQLMWYDIGAWIEVTEDFILKTLDERNQYLNLTSLKINKLKSN